MPFLDITTAHASFQNRIYAFRRLTLFPGTFIFDNEKRFASSWKNFYILGKTKNPSVGRIEVRRGGSMIIKAVATLELTRSAQSSDEHNDYQNLMDAYSGKSPVFDHQSLSEGAKELDEREKLRRMRISKANKGNTPWNKGRKHSPETLQLIRERTRLAMQDPKVKKKLANLGHAQSEETKIKIGVGVRMGWERRRGRQMLQETCHLEWQNLIAEASRKGFLGEEELQWDSYKIMNEQLEQEWLASVEQRKNMPRPKGNKRAPKSPEQRRKIAEAIAAKWADPVYREKVYLGLAKYHGSQPGVERKSRRTPNGDGVPRKRSPAKKQANDTANTTATETKSHMLRSRLKRSNVPLYKDPLASSKLEMIKSIRAQRAAADTQKTEAIIRAKLLIAEAEKAAKALEAAATRSHLAQASLIETRMLIAEAIRSIESVEKGWADSYENGRCPPLASTETGEADSNDNDQPSLLNHVDAGYFDSNENGRCLPLTSTKIVNHVETGKGIKVEDPSQTDRRIVNGTYSLSENDIQNFDFRNLTPQDILNDRNKTSSTNISNYSLLDGNEKLFPTSSCDYDSPSSVLDGMLKQTTFTKKLRQLEPNGSSRHQKNMPRSEEESKKEEASSAIILTKKWVCGKLIEVAEGG